MKTETSVVYVISLLVDANRTGFNSIARRRRGKERKNLASLIDCDEHPLVTLSLSTRAQPTCSSPLSTVATTTIRARFFLQLPTTSTFSKSTRRRYVPCLSMTRRTTPFGPSRRRTTSRPWPPFGRTAYDKPATSYFDTEQIQMNLYPEYAQQPYYGGVHGQCDSRIYLSRCALIRQVRRARSFYSVFQRQSRI